MEPHVQDAKAAHKEMTGLGMPWKDQFGYPQAVRVGDTTRAGAKDMVRISDARMSGTAFGRLYAEHVLQAAQGCDFDFLRAP